LLAKLKVAGSILGRSFYPDDLVVGRRSKDLCLDASRQVSGIVTAVVVLAAIVVRSSVRSGRFHNGEDFPDLDASLGLDHDKLSALQGRITAKRTEEPSDVSHHAIPH
jgi:hypothetical protein